MVLALGTLILIAIGGLVTSHGVGMAVPDWPNSYGYNMFAFPVSQWVGGILYEHSHRLWASLVGFLTLWLALWVNGKASRPWLRGFGIVCAVLGAAAAFKGSISLGNVIFLLATGVAAYFVGRVWPQCDAAPRSLRWLTLAALALVLIQGLFGGLRVVMMIDSLGIVHAALAQLFFCLSAVLAVLFNGRWKAWRNASLRETTNPRMFGLVLTLSIVIFAQLLLGASMRHQHAGLAVPDFPLAYGKIWPPTDAAFLELINNSRVDVRDFHPITGGQILLHMIHRLTALAIVGLVVVVVGLAFREASCAWRRWSMAGAALVSVQAGLGAWTVWSNKAADIATAHVVVGALTLVWSVLFTMALAVNRESRKNSNSGARPQEPVWSHAQASTT